MRDTDLYLGVWTLVPELSLYEIGDPPASGVYEIRAASDGRVMFGVRWRARDDDESREIAFGGPPDGSAQPLPAPAEGAPDALAITRVDGRTLDSEALRGGRRLAWARRVASADGSLLAVVQEIATPGGGHARNFQVYRRAAGA